MSCVRPQAMRKCSTRDSPSAFQAHWNSCVCRNAKFSIERTEPFLNSDHTYHQREIVIKHASQTWQGFFFFTTLSFSSASLFLPKSHKLKAGAITFSRGPSMPRSLPQTFSQIDYPWGLGFWLRQLGLCSNSGSSLVREMVWGWFINLSVSVYLFNRMTTSILSCFVVLLFVSFSAHFVTCPSHAHLPVTPSPQPPTPPPATLNLFPRVQYLS